MWVTYTRENYFCSKKYISVSFSYKILCLCLEILRKSLILYNANYKIAFSPTRIHFCV